MNSDSKLAALESLYIESLSQRDIEGILKHGKAYFDALRGGAMLPVDREKLQHQIWAIRAQDPNMPNT